MLFAVCADRGAPGVTTAALALAAARGLPALVVEADPYGGDLALRLRPGRSGAAAEDTYPAGARGRGPGHTGLQPRAGEPVAAQ